MMNKKWFNSAIICLVISILSFCFSVIRFTTSTGNYTINIFDILFKTYNYYYLMTHYSGPILLDLANGLQVLLALLAIASVACAFIGLYTLRAQRPNTKQFYLTIAGLVGCCIPSFIAMMYVVECGKYSTVEVGLGIAPIITPIAMLVCIRAVIRRRNKVLEELRLEVEKKGLIQKAGDLL